jgi:hypothetical protein
MKVFLSLISKARRYFKVGLIYYTVWTGTEFSKARSNILLYVSEFRRRVDHVVIGISGSNPEQVEYEI